MNELLDKLKTLLKDQTEKKLKEKEILLSIAPSFDGVLEFLQKLEYPIQEMRISWLKIKLTLICISACKACIDGEFFNKLYERFDGFDNIDNLQWLIAIISEKISAKQNNNENKESVENTQMHMDDILQHLYQVYISDFAFAKHSTVDNIMIQRFMEGIVDACVSNEKKQKTDIPLSLNTFSQLQTMSTMLKVTRSKDIVSKYAKTALDKMMEQLLTVDESSIALLLLNSQQQYLEYRYKKNNKGKIMMPVSEEQLNEAVTNLNASLVDSVFLQLLAIAEIKLIIEKFVNYASFYLKKVKFTDNGLVYKKNVRIKASYLTKLAEIFEIKNDMREDTSSIKRGLQYFFILCLWKIVGASRTIALTQSSVFKKTLHITLFDDQKDDEKLADNIPRDDPFLLTTKHDELYNEIGIAIVNNQKVAWKDKLKLQHSVFVIGKLFDCSYLNTDKNNKIKPQNLYALTNEILRNNIYKNKVTDTDQRTRITQLLTTLAFNEMPAKFLRYGKSRSLEDIQCIRLMYHFVGVVLSLPKSPFSILFHSPLDYDNGYIVGMPEDQSSQLLKTNAGSAAWLCP
eukprot:527199_1